MIKKWLIIFSLFFYLYSFSQETDTNKLRKIYIQAFNLERSSPKDAIKLYQSIISITKLNCNQTIVGETFHRLAEVTYGQEKKLETYFDYCFKSIKIFESLQDSLQAITVYQNLGLMLVRQRRFPEAISYHIAVEKYGKLHNISKLIIASEMSLADCYSSLERSDTAIAILKKLADNYPEDGTMGDFGMLLNNLGNSYYNYADNTSDRHYFLTSITYAEKARDILIKLPSHIDDLAYSYGLLGACYMAIGKYNDSEKNYKLAITIYNTKNQIGDLELMYYELTQLNIKQGKTDNALLCLMTYDSLSKHLFNEENSVSISTMKTQFETEKKENENKILQTKNRQQKTISVFIVIGLVLTIGLAFFIFRGLKQERKANYIISEQKELVEEHQKEILDSIRYAKRIQTALLANIDLVDSNTPANFILFKPKDIVSGDFYWATEHHNRFYLAVCDCTGHGVPGAFMSLLNIGFLSEAIKEKNIEKPNEVFNYVRTRLINSISNDGQQDGMDGILLCIDKTLNQISYAAANNEPVLISDNNVIELSKDKMPVGKGEKTESFTLYTINANKGDTLYLYTDGYADQFGGPKGKKFKYKQLNELLLSVNNKSMEHQKNELNSVIEHWKGNLEQVDDVLVIGIKF